MVKVVTVQQAPMGPRMGVAAITLHQAPKHLHTAAPYKWEAPQSMALKAIA